MPSCGAPPAWLARPVKRICLISERVVGGAQTVELADKRQARTGPAASEAALDPGQGQAGLRFEAERAHLVGDQRRGAVLVEAGFRVMQDRLAELDDLVAVAID